RGRDEPRRRLLALRAVAARERVGARLDHGRQRRDLRGAPVGLRRMAVRPRPGLPDADGAAGPPGRLRGGGVGLREAEPRQRGRVPAQGADAAVVVALPVRGEAAARGAAEVAVRAGLAPRAPLRERLPAPDPARDLDRAGERGLAVRGRARRAGAVAGARRRREAEGARPGSRARLVLPADDRGYHGRARALP